MIGEIQFAIFHLQMQHIFCVLHDHLLKLSPGGFGHICLQFSKMYFTFGYNVFFAFCFIKEVRRAFQNHSSRKDYKDHFHFHLFLIKATPGTHHFPQKFFKTSSEHVTT